MGLKETILNESLRLFSLKGYLSTSIRDILEASGSSRGGLYNHFKNKNELLLAVLGEARRIWRESNLNNLDSTENPIEKLKILLMNYRDRYLKDAKKLPGGCFFITLSVELDDQAPELAHEVNKGFGKFRNLIKRFLNQGKDSGQLREDVDTQAVSEMIFAALLGAAVFYGAEKSEAATDQTFDTLLAHIDTLLSKN